MRNCQLVPGVPSLPTKHENLPKAHWHDGAWGGGGSRDDDARRLGRGLNVRRNRRARDEHLHVRRRKRVPLLPRPAPRPSPVSRRITSPAPGLRGVTREDVRIITRRTAGANWFPAESLVTRI